MALDRIVAKTRENVARRKRETPLAVLTAAARPGDRSLAAALRVGRTGFVLECKRASPSEGLIRRDYDPAALAAVYAEHADAISVLTDGPFFQGSLDHLRAVRQSVRAPVLCKDFVVDPYQIFEARAYGADAVLLLLSVLEDAAYRECAAAAREAGLETVTEVHDERELDRALVLGAEVIGINNRDLETLEVDLGTVRHLAPRIPRDRVVLCESGIRTHEDVLELRAVVDGFLVGTSLMRQPDLSAAVRRLVYGVTKVCGLTRAADAQAAWRAGATHGGAIFATESPRRVSEETARALRNAAPLHWVGIFVNETPERIAELADRLCLAAVQLHGEETREEVALLRTLLGERCEIWKAVRVREAIPRVEDTGADRLLLDTWQPDQRGGTGARFDWSLVERHPQRDRLILSGGITPEVAGAADRLGVWGLDVNSGVEESPGVKSALRLDALFAARRGRGREREHP